MLEKKDIKVQDIPEAKIHVKANKVYIDKCEYELVVNYRDAFQVDIFQDRYTKLLQKYHYIVGDWGHEQLRLKGFYHDKVKHVDALAKIHALDDYLKEYCAFGCAYFVLKVVDEPIPFKEDKPKFSKSNQSRRKTFHKPKGKHQYDSEKEKTLQKTKSTAKSKHKKQHDFVIRKGQDR